MITVDRFIPRCGCRSVGECTHGLEAEGEALDELVDAFADEMKAKLRRKWREGYSGWDVPANRPGINAKLFEHVLRTGPQWVDIANLAAMLWNLDNGEAERIEALVAAPGGPARDAPPGA